MLGLAALAHGHEEFDGAVHRAAIGQDHGQEGDDQVQALGALLGPVLDLLGHGVQRALRAAFYHGAQRVGCGSRRSRRRRGGRLFSRFGRMGLEHGAQDGVGPVGGQALEACLPGLAVQVLKSS